MTELRKYQIDTPAGPVTVQLSDAEAKERGLKPAEAQPEKAAEPGKRSSTAIKRAAVADKSFGPKKT